MSDPKGFLKYPRETPPYRPVEERLTDHRDVVHTQAFSPEQTLQQAARCMDCGVPFCHHGCPLGNLVPGFNLAVQLGNWAEAYRLLYQTNDFPEFTGRICPAPCEHACVLGINQDPVAIEHIEQRIIETAFEQGWVQAQLPDRRSGKKVAIVGSGPAGLAAANQLNRLGHSVTVFEKNHKPGGLLRYGIPDFKLEKWVVDRRIDLMIAEGIEFCCATEIGRNCSAKELTDQYDAVLLTTGSTAPRELKIPGCDLPDVHYAMDYLTQNNQNVAGESTSGFPISATGKHVVVIGGGDTGSDCVGTANRQGALSVAQLQYRPRPSEQRTDETPWPLPPMTLTVSSSHEEGCERAWEVQAKAFISGPDGRVQRLQLVELIWEKDPKTGRYAFMEKPGSAYEIPCELALIAIGYRGVASSPMWEELGLRTDDNGLLPAQNYRTKHPKVFVAGDARRGQSLVVWAIAEGRAAGEVVDLVLGEGEC